MALGTPTQKLNESSGFLFSTAGWTTGSFTPSSSVTLIANVFGRDEGGSNLNTLATIADSLGGTWTRRSGPVGFDEGFGNWLYVSQYTRPVVTGASMTITLDAGAAQIANWHIIVQEISGSVDFTSIATGSDASMATDGADSFELSGAPASSSVVIAALGRRCDSSSTTTPGTGWTELAELGTQDEFNGQVQYRTGSTSTTVGWDDVRATGSMSFVLGAAFEIKESGGGGGATNTGRRALLGVGS